MEFQLTVGQRYSFLSDLSSVKLQHLLSIELHKRYGGSLSDDYGWLVLEEFTVSLPYFMYSILSIYSSYIYSMSIKHSKTLEASQTETECVRSQTHAFSRRTLDELYPQV